MPLRQATAVVILHTLLIIRIDCRPSAMSKFAVHMPGRFVNISMHGSPAVCAWRRVQVFISTFLLIEEEGSKVFSKLSTAVFCSTKLCG